MGDVYLPTVREEVTEMGLTKEERLAREVASLSDDDLMREWTKSGEEAQALKERLGAFSAEHQRRTRKAALAAVAATMSDDDLALLQEARAEGIESKEAVDNG